MKKKQLNLLIIGVLVFLWIRKRGLISGDNSSGYGGGLADI